jgi:hypothetical protein
MTPKQDDPVVPPPKPGDAVSMTPKQDDPVVPPKPEKKIEDEPGKSRKSGKLRPVVAKKENPLKPPKKAKTAGRPRKEEIPVTLPTPGGIKPARSRKGKAATAGQGKKIMPKLLTQLVKLDQITDIKGTKARLRSDSIPKPLNALKKSYVNALIRDARILFNLPAQAAQTAFPDYVRLTPDSPLLKDVAYLGGSQLDLYFPHNAGVFVLLSGSHGNIHLQLYKLTIGKIYVINFNLDCWAREAARFSAWVSEGNLMTGLQIKDDHIPLAFIAKKEYAHVYLEQENSKYTYTWYFSGVDIIPAG